MLVIAFTFKTWKPPNEFYVLIDSHESKSPEVFKVRQKHTLPILSSLGS